jgi:hypothetical protein
MKIDYNLCSIYELTTNYDDDGNADTYRSGKCVDKHEIDKLETEGVGAALIVNISFWERKIQDSIWRIGTADIGMTLLNFGIKEEKKAFRIGKH